MSLHQCRTETMQQAKRFLADLEAFLDLMRACTPQERARELHWLPALRWAIATAATSHSHAMDHFRRFEATCRLLARPRPPVGFSESRAIAHATREVMRIREVLHEIGRLPRSTTCRSPAEA